MCDIQIHAYNVDGLSIAIRELEQRHGMDSDEFLVRYRNGSMDTFLGNFWAGLLEERGAMAAERRDVKQGNQRLVEAARSLSGAGAV